MTESLKDLAIGERAAVVGFREGAKHYRQKLLAMGLTPGTQLSVVRVAPLGDPVEIKVRGFSLSLRKDEADALQIERLIG